MRCTQVKLLLSTYLDGAMTGKLMLSLAGHLDACDRCQQEYLDSASDAAVAYHSRPPEGARRIWL